jgi:PhnB protein
MHLVSDSTAPNAGGTALEGGHFYGDRVATFDDPYGHRWNIGTHIEDVAPEELGHRAPQLMSRWST